MKFQFDKISDEMLKLVLESEEKDNFVISGSYALYGIYFKNHNVTNRINIKFKDLDFDINDLVNRNKSDEEIKEIIIEYVNNKFITIFEKLEGYENVLNWEVIWNETNIKERKNNQNNFGTNITILIEDYFDQYYFTFDIGFETKQFELLEKYTNIFNKDYKVKVYNLEKQLADKYLAVLKRFNIIFSEKENKKTKYANIWKISKDLFDINMIKTQPLDKLKVEKNMKQMIYPEYKINIKEFITFVDKIISRHSETTKERGVNINLANEKEEFKQLLKRNKLEM